MTDFLADVILLHFNRGGEINYDDFSRYGTEIAHLLSNYCPFLTGVITSNAMLTVLTYGELCTDFN